MWVDSEHLRDFYRSKLGCLVQRKVTAAIEKLWPNTKDDVVVGYGFCVPYLGIFDGEAERVLSFMPAPQGAFPWPKSRKNLTTLVEEHSLPLRDQSVDRLIICHALEYSDNVHEILEECWRVLVDGGELLVITPNRRSVWAQTTSTPLGYGTPYTGHQMFDVLKNANFSPAKPLYCLYNPPTENSVVLKLSTTFEKYGAWVSPKLGGILAFSAQKETYARTSKKVTHWVPRAFTQKVT